MRGPSWPMVRAPGANAAIPERRPICMMGATSAEIIDLDRSRPPEDAQRHHGRDGERVQQLARAHQMVASPRRTGTQPPPTVAVTPPDVRCAVAWSREGRPISTP